jgi:hypothetical protein
MRNSMMETIRNNHLKRFEFTDDMGLAYRYE